MSELTDTAADKTTTAAPVEQPAKADAPSPSKGKGKAVQEVAMDDDEDDDDDDEAEDEDDDDEMEEDNLEEIDTSAILAPGARRSTRGVRIDYSSEEALKKAGLTPEQAEEEEHEDTFVAPDDEMKD
ncbi:hypothetical protein BXZ70DRAFT_913047 [Cristinia sonorae]|uniref:Histone chaperone domain-containing protein n=1 Tax=Cristinia sonorae TaxID=1940300 RepID=A0A8K0V034_9AGAR|nr:hypothetical protein BXZ70DRAFT_913047 [Cristinia sonorae]